MSPHTTPPPRPTFSSSPPLRMLSITEDALPPPWRRRMLSITQSDVTPRVRLETSMAHMAEKHIDMLGQVGDSYTG